MADTTKTLQEKLNKLKENLKAKEKETKAAYDIWFAQKMDFENNKNQMQDAVKQKAAAEVAKLDAAYRKLHAEKDGLDLKIKTVQKAVDKYIDEKTKLKADKVTGEIDKDEYAKRKTLLKEIVKKAGTVKRSEQEKLKERLKKKEGELNSQSANVASHQSFYNDAKKFVNAGLDGDEKKVAAKCMEFFGKKKMTQKEAETALKKVETTLKEFQKEERILQDEVKLLTEQVNEGDKRLKALETDLSRSVESLKIGGLTPEQFKVVKANFEKTLAIK